MTQVPTQVGLNKCGIHSKYDGLVGGNFRVNVNVDRFTESVYKIEK